MTVPESTAGIVQINGGTSTGGPHRAIQIY